MNIFVVHSGSDHSVEATVKSIETFAKEKAAEDASETVYIVYTDEESNPYAVPYEEPNTYKRAYYPLTMDEREWIAEMLAGKAADRTEACQRMIATVIYNDITACEGDVEMAAERFGLKDSKTPSEQIYKVVDAVFYQGELMLDPEVLYFNDAQHKSAFHESLVYECECDGIVFYREHRPAIEVQR